MKKVLILGVDGYIGWQLAIHLLEKGHTVIGLDNYIRRRRVREIGSKSLTPIKKTLERDEILKQYPNFIDEVILCNLGSSQSSWLGNILTEYHPDTIVHLAEQPSAPWSMIDAEHAAITQQENIIGTLYILWAMKKNCPNAHLVKIGTMGEYGTPECDIPEGIVPKKCISYKPTGYGEFPDCPMQGLLFPRTPGSFYHLTKVHDTYNIHFACRNWGLRSTDIMQGVVFGLGNYTEPHQLTRFDYDEYFGTVINRFCAQVLIEHPLTIYGRGEQTRGYLPLQDSIQCLTLVIENPPELGEYRTLNQFENIYSVNTLAEMVWESAEDLGFNAKIDHIPNPRKEAESHYYNPTHQKLFDMGYVPTRDIQSEIRTLIEKLIPFKDRINPAVIMPKTEWR